MTQYRIYDCQERVFVSALYKCRRRASARANKLDLEYGAVRYSVKEIKE